MGGDDDNESQTGVVLSAGDCSPMTSFDKGGPPDVKSFEDGRIG